MATAGMFRSLRVSGAIYVKLFVCVEYAILFTLNIRISVQDGIFVELRCAVRRTPGHSLIRDSERVQGADPRAKLADTRVKKTPF